MTEKPISTLTITILLNRNCDFFYIKLRHKIQNRKTGLMNKLKAFPPIDYKKYRL